MLTENYIKMCEQNEDLYKEWKPKKGDCYIAKFCKDELFFINNNNECKYLLKEECIYMPTQEQLQEMVFSKDNFYDNLSDFYCFLCEEYTYFTILNTKAEREKYNNMNEFWLAFVMQEKYNKVWTGEKWELIK